MESDNRHEKAERLSQELRHMGIQVRCDPYRGPYQVIIEYLFDNELEGILELLREIREPHHKGEHSK